jgi:hypothetical protein
MFIIIFCATAVDFEVFGFPLSYNCVGLPGNYVLPYLKDYDMQLQDYTLYYALIPVIPQS